MHVLYTTNETDYDIIDAQLNHIYLATNPSKLPITEETLSKQFAEGLIHTACVEGILPSSRKFRGCKIVSVQRRGLFLIMKED